MELKGRNATWLELAVAPLWRLGQTRVRVHRRCPCWWTTSTTSPMVAGVDHVGLGSDFDGAPFMPVGIDGVQYLPKLSAALKARGYSEADLAKILGGNILRVLEASQPPAP